MSVHAKIVRQRRQPLNSSVSHLCQHLSLLVANTLTSRYPVPGRHEAITERLGIKPTEAWNVGDTNDDNGLPRKFMAWRFRSGLDDAHPLKQHIEILLLWFATRADAARSLWVDYDLTLQCVGYYPASRGSGMHFNREVIRQAAQLGLEIDCDHYFVEDHGHDG